MSTALVTHALSIGHQRTPVVDGLDLRLDRGQSLALVGANGSGKSTLLSTIAGLLAPLGGEIDVLGQAPPIGGGRVALLSQFSADNPLLALRARDVVTMGRYPRRGLLGRLGPADRAAVDQALDRVGATDLAGHTARDLSGGQRQRIRLAQVLAHQADLLLLDEPTSGLDAAAMERYHQAVAAERARGASVVTATHDVRDAATYDQVLLLAGRVVAYGPPSAVLTPESLLDAFGISLLAIPHDGHTDLVIPDAGHDHGHHHTEHGSTSGHNISHPD